MSSTAATAAPFGSRASSGNRSEKPPMGAAAYAPALFLSWVLKIYDLAGKEDIEINA
jgi:hypothetical protein